MTSPEVRRYDDAATLADRVAAELLDLLAGLQALGRAPQVALTGGTIADDIHREVARQAPASGVDWGAVDFWWGDERFVPADSPDRNAGQARAAFLDAVGATRVHEMPASDAGMSIEKAAAAYSEEMRASPGHDFDLVMLGVGPDGHIASLFPGRSEGDSPDHIAIPVLDSPKPPPERISLTFEALCRSARVWFVVSGPEKATAATRAIAGDQSLPAAHVHGMIETLWHLA